MVTINEVSEEGEETPLVPINTKLNNGKISLSAGEIVFSVLKDGLLVVWSFTLSEYLAFLSVASLYFSETPNADINASALAFAVNSMHTVTVLGIGFPYAVGNFNSFDAKEFERDPQKKIEIAKRFRSTAIILAPIAIGASSILYFEGSILPFLGVAPEIAKTAQILTRPYFLGPFFSLVRILVENVLLPFGMFKTAAACAVPSLGAAIGLALFLALGPLNMAWKGLSYGALTESVLAAISMLLVLALHPKFKDIPFFKAFFMSYKGFFSKDLKPLWPVVRAIYFGISGTVASDFLLVLYASFLSGKKSAPIPSAAIQSVLALSLLMLLVELAFRKVLNIKVGNQKGENRFLDASRMARIGFGTAAVFLALLLAPIAIFRETFIRGFNPSISTEVMVLAKKIIPISAAERFVNTLNGIMIEESFHAGDFSWPTRILNGGLLVGAVGGYLLGVWKESDLVDVVLYFLAGKLATFAVEFPRWWKKTTPENFERVYEGEINPDAIVESTLESNEQSWAKTFTDNFSAATAWCGSFCPRVDNRSVEEQNVSIRDFTNIQGLSN